MKKFWIFHPILFALYPVLFLFSYNIQEYREEILGLPVFLSILFGGTVYLVCFLIFRKIQPAAILASSIILIFFSYSRVQEQIKNLYLNFGSFTLGPDKVLLLTLPLVLVFVIFLIFKFKYYLRSTNKVLNIISLVLVLFTLFNIGLFEFKTGRIWTIDLDFGLSDEDEVAGNIEKPDIYYIVFEDYASNKTTKLYGFDNSDFLNDLRNKDFYIAENATSNYPKTFLSMGSVLNLGYVNYLTEKTNGGGTSDQSIVTPLVKNNKVIKFLKKQGYKYIHVGSGWDPTRSNKNADVNYVLKGGANPYQDEFSNGLIHTTLAAPILRTLFPDTTAVSENPKDNEERSRVIFEFNSLNEIPNIPGPKFVFFHVLSPHDPYVFDKDCNPIPESVIENKSEIENYINQMRCINKKTKAAIENILSKSKTPPVIILGTDEGSPNPFKYPLPKKRVWKNASNETLNEKFPIIAAFYLPGLEKNPIYSSITPVNYFRVLFNSYFGTHYKVLPDKNFIFDDENNYYKFTDVTNRINVDRSEAPAAK